MQTVTILGRQTGIALAELESLHGAENVRAVEKHAAVVEGAVDFARIGGSSKTAKPLTTLDTIHWGEVQKHLENNVPKHLHHLGEGKLRLGISAYGFNVSPQRITATGLNLKKVIRASGRSVRLVPNNELALNSAQVIHNKLTEPSGLELLIVKDGTKTILAQTLGEQDIEAYALRDRGRPMRDARIGMLPPKLAQIIINLAAPDQSRSPIRAQDTKSEMQPESPADSARSGVLSSDRRKGDRKIKILDPFCGTGVILQEAGLMGYGVYGTDLDERMVDYSRQNLHWLTTKTDYDGFDSRFEIGDATSYQWPHEYDAIASETYLGRAFTSLPSPEMLEKNRRDCDTIIQKFLKNVYAQTKLGFRLSLAAPAWFANGQVYRLPLLDSLGELGYNRIEFEHAASKDLIYHRDGQIVGRELIALTRK